MSRVALLRHLDHLCRPVNRHDGATAHPLAHERHRGAVTAADLQEPIVGLDPQRLYRHTSRSEALILFIAPLFHLLGIIDTVLFANSVSDVVPFAKQHLQVQG
jgi:hypothetical protein